MAEFLIFTAFGKKKIRREGASSLDLSDHKSRRQVNNDFIDVVEFSPSGLEGNRTDGNSADDGGQPGQSGFDP